MTAWLDLSKDIEEDFLSFNPTLFDRFVAFEAFQRSQTDFRLGFNRYRGPGLKMNTSVPILPRPIGRPFKRVVCIIAKINQRSGYSVALERGVCGKCYVRPLLTKTRCALCLEYQRALTRRKMTARMQSGMCARCGRMLGRTNVWRCKACRESRNKYPPGVRPPRPDKRLSVELQDHIRSVLLTLRSKHGNWRILAKAMDVSFDALSRTSKKGRPITKTHAGWIARFTGVNLDELIKVGFGAEPHHVGGPNDQACYSVHIAAKKGNGMTESIIDRLLREREESRARMSAALAILRTMSRSERLDILEELVRQLETNSPRVGSRVEPSRALSHSSGGTRLTLRRLVYGVLMTASEPLSSAAIVERVTKTDALCKPASIAAVIQQMKIDGLVVAEASENYRQMVYTLTSDARVNGVEPSSGRGLTDVLRQVFRETNAEGFLLRDLYTAVRERRPDTTNGQVRSSVSRLIREGEVRYRDKKYWPSFANGVDADVAALHPEESHEPS